MPIDLSRAATGLLLIAVAAGPVAAAPQIQTWQTPNGAKVLFVEATDLPMLDIRVVFDAGSARDGEQSGIASLTAALLKQGAGDWDADAIAERLEGVGAELGAGADRDMTSVSLRTLTRGPALEPAIDTLTEILARPRFAAEDFERVQQNLLIGLHQDEQSPGTVGKKALYRNIFGTHPYAADPSGTLESVAALTRDDASAFHRKHYVAANAVIAIVGAVNRAAAEVLAARISADLPRGEPAPPLPQVPPLAEAMSIDIDFPSSQTHIYAGQPGMQRGDPDYFQLYVGNHILGGSGLVSLLMEEVREKRGLSYSVYSYFLPLAVDGPFMLGLQTKNSQAEEARRVMLETLERFAEHGPTDDELTAALKNITGGFPLRIASNGKIVRYLAVIGFYNLPLDYLDRFNDRVSAVTKEQIRDAFQRRIHADRLAIVEVGPGPARMASHGDRP